MSPKLENTLNQLKVLVLCGLVVLASQATNLWKASLKAAPDNPVAQLDLLTSIGGMAIIILISVVALKIKEVLPLQIPAFAWASLLALILTTPWSPVQGIILKLTSQISAGVIGTCILAIAGITIGCKLNEVKKLSWKIILVSFVVFIGTFFGSALVAELILKMQGII